MQMEHIIRLLNHVNRRSWSQTFIHSCNVSDICGNKDYSIGSLMPTQSVTQTSKYSPTNPTSTVRNSDHVCKIGFLFCLAVQTCYPKPWICRGIVNCGYENDKMLGKLFQPYILFYFSNICICLKLHVLEHFNSF